MRLPLLCALFISLQLQFTYAQIQCIEFIEMEEIISIVDDDNFIWCGTKEHGLVRINKLTLERTYWNVDNSSISDNRIKSVLKYDNRIYFSSDISLMVIEDQTIVSVNDSIEGLLLEDNIGRLLVAGRRDLYILNTSGAIQYHHNLMDIVNDQCCSNVTDIVVDSNGHIWLNHHDFYVYHILKFDGTDWTVFDKWNTPILPIESFDENKLAVIDNQVFATNWGGLYLFENNEWSGVHLYNQSSILNDFDTLLNHGPLPIETDSENVLWVGGVHYMNGSVLTFNRNNSWHFANNHINPLPYINLLEDSKVDENVMYAGTQEGLLIIQKDCLYQTTTVHDVQAENSIEIFPNPTDGQLYFQSKLPIEKIELFDIHGKSIAKFQKISQSINLSKLSSGCYFLQFFANGEFVTEKVFLHPK